MRIGNQNFDQKDHTYVMGILNVTPDSFSDGGHYNQIDAALYHAEEMIKAGAALIDVGGESTRPGYTLISDEEEMERTAPVIAKIKEHYDIPISLDTYKSQVAQAGIEAGADLINDIWGLQYDERMGDVVAKNKISYCLMHNRKEMLAQRDAASFIEELQEDIDRALAYNIAPEQIILDPGVGFAKSQEDNLMTIANLDRMMELGYPVLLGTSRKSVINYVLQTPVDQRLEGTLATTAYAVMNHVPFVRVHDVLENVRMIQMMEAIAAHR